MQPRFVAKFLSHVHVSKSTKVSKRFSSVSIKTTGEFAHSREVVTAGLDGLDEEAAGGRVAVHGTDEVLHWGLMGQADQVTDVVHDQPGQMLRVMEVLTLHIHTHKHTHTHTHTHTEGERERRVEAR